MLLFYLYSTTFQWFFGFIVCFMYSQFTGKISFEWILCSLSLSVFKPRLQKLWQWHTWFCSPTGSCESHPSLCPNGRRWPWPCPRRSFAWLYTLRCIWRVWRDWSTASCTPPRPRSTNVWLGRVGIESSRSLRRSNPWWWGLSHPPQTYYPRAPSSTTWCLIIYLKREARKLVLQHEPPFKQAWYGNTYSCNKTKTKTKPKIITLDPTTLKWWSISIDIQKSMICVDWYRWYMYSMGTNIKDSRTNVHEILPSNAYTRDSTLLFKASIWCFRRQLLKSLYSLIWDFYCLKLIYGPQQYGLMFGSSYPNHLDMSS